MKILITMPYNPNIISILYEQIEKLSKLGFNVELDRSMKRLTENEIIDRTKKVFAHICGADAWTEKAINSNDSIKIISRIGVGYDTVDLTSATRKKIAVTITPGAGAESVSEYCLAMMLAFSRNVLLADNEVRNNGWKKYAGPSLFRKKLGLIGLGNIGKQLSKIVVGFGMEILAYDKFQDEKFAAKNNIKYCELETLLNESDFISVHVPLTKKTKNMISQKELLLMKPGAVIVNAARGGIINEKDLFCALKNKTIAGACLDVFDNEPIGPENPLLNLSNIILSPHNAGSSLEGKNQVFEAAVKNVIDYYLGKKPTGLLNEEVLN